jgi:hypothetical protein
MTGKSVLSVCMVYGLIINDFGNAFNLPLGVAKVGFNVK